MEGLEERALLSVSPADYAAIRNAYPALNLPENSAAVNVIEIESTNLTVASLKDAIAAAAKTSNDDLVVVRTTDAANKIAFADGSDEIEIELDSSKNGALNVVAFGTQPLTIDAMQQSRAIYVGTGTIGLAHLAITGGKDNNGGGIYNYDGEITAIHCSISNNAATYDGGGIYNIDGKITATNCSISNNTASSGGGIYNNSGEVTATGCSITNNASTSSGGGIFNDCYLTLVNSVISNNVASGAGGGIYGDHDAGGIGGRNNRITATNCVILNNAANNGGGLFNWDRSISAVTNCEFSGNTATVYGGGIYCKGDLTTSNCTIAGNYASYGGGIYNYSNSSTTAYNTIVALNMSGGVGFNTWNGLSESSANNLVGSNPNFVVPPVFSGGGKLANADAFDLRLCNGSSAIDAGSNAAVSEVATDLSGAARIYNGTVDLGAYEYQGGSADPQYYSSVVDSLADALDPNDGQWTLREAVCYASKYETITFAENLGGTIVFTLGQLSISQPLSIDGGGRITLDADQKSRVINVSGGTEGTPVTLSGLTIQNGKDSNDSGGGVILESGTLVLNDCTISNCQTSYNGGGFYVVNGTATAGRCTISNNDASGDGDGIYVAKGTTTLNDCSIVGNQGNGIYNLGTTYANNCMIADNTDSGIVNAYSRYSDATLTAKNCVISGNKGSGIVNNETLAALNCLIVGNGSAKVYGGGIKNDSGLLTVTNCTIANNQAYYGGGIYGTGTVNVYNSIVALNTSGNKDVNDDVYNPAEISGSNNLSTCTSWIGNDNIEYDATLPLFKNAGAGDYRLATGSQAFDGGNNHFALDAGLNENSLDLAGNPRFVGAAIDVGACESTGTIDSQRSVYCGEARLEWETYENATNVRLTWTTGTTTNLLGTFDVAGAYDWNTTPFNDGYGVLTFEYLDSKGAVVAKSEIVGLILNDENVVVCRGEIAGSTVWNSDKVYLVVGKLNVVSGATLTIAENAVVKFWKNSFIDVSKDATLNIGDRATLTRVEDDSVGGDTNKDGSLSVPKFSGAYYRGEGAINVGVGVVVKYVNATVSGRIAQDSTWFAGQVYRVTESVVVPSGVTLTIMPGAIVKFDAGCSLNVESGGKLVAEGTTAQPIVFTSIKDDEYGGDSDEDDGENAALPGDWGGVEVSGSATIKHAILRYGAPSNESGILAVYSEGSLDLDSCVVSHAKYDGIWNWGGAITARNVVVTDVGCATAPFRGTQTYVNCVFDSVSYMSMYWSQWTGKGDYVNCVFSNPLTDWLDTQGSTTYLSNLSYRNCVFYSESGADRGTFGAVGSNGNIAANPLFRDAENGNYRLAAGSPCIDAGTIEGAPETDADGVARYDDPNVANNGESYVDIGAYEFADSASSAIDLEPVDVQAPAKVGVGESITVQWTIRNNGTDAASSVWRDSFYFISSTGRKVAAQDVLLSRNIAPGDLQTFYARITVPNLEEGEWTLGVTVNPNREIFEGVNVANNAISANTSTVVSVATFKSGEKFELDVDVPTLVKYVVPAGEARKLSFTSNNSVTILARENYVPSSALCDAQAVETSENSYVLFLEAGDQDRTFYLQISASKKGTSVEANAEKASFALLALPNARLGNSGASTVDLVGIGFGEGTKAKIVSDGKTIAEASVVVSSPTKGTARFDLTGVAPGKYDVVIERNGETSTLNDAITVVASETQANIKAWLEYPEAVREGRVYQGKIHYQNEETTDATPRIFHLNSTGELGLSSDALSGSDLWVFGVGSAESAGVLKPGESNEIVFYFKAAEQTTFELSHVLYEDDEAYDETSPWNTWGEYVEALSDAATRLNRRGAQISSLYTLKSFAKQATTDVGACVISGVATDKNTGEVAANRLYVAYCLTDSNELSDPIYTTTDENGRFKFVNVTANTTAYILQVFSDSEDVWEIAVKDADVLDLKLTATDMTTADFGADPDLLLDSDEDSDAEEVSNVLNVGVLKTSEHTAKWDNLDGDEKRPIYVERDDDIEKNDDGLRILGGTTWSCAISPTGIITEVPVIHYWKGAEEDTRIEEESHARDMYNMEGRNYNTQYEVYEGEARAADEVAKYWQTQSDKKTEELNSDVLTPSEERKLIAQRQKCDENVLHFTELANQWRKKAQTASKKTINRSLYIDDYKKILGIPEQAVARKFQNSLGTFGSLRLEIVTEEGKDAQSSLNTPTSIDPNEIVGPIGYDYAVVNKGTEDEPFAVITSPNWISADSEAEQSYKIYFENKSTSTAAAQEIFVTTQLPENFDWNTFELREICVGTQIFDVSEGCSDGVWTFDQTSTGDQIQLTVDYDPTTGLANWYLRSYVSETVDHFPTSAYDGFLPPNDESTGDGEGYVSFVVKLDEGLKTGAKVETNATIVFDVNEPITTNLWFNTIDADAPSVALVSVDANENGTATLVWNGSDVGSGVVSYDLYYSTDDGATFTKSASTSDATATFSAPEAGNYVFYVVARDGVGNETSSEISASVALEARVEPTEKPAAPGDLIFGEYDETTRSVSVSWSDNSSNEEKFNVEISFDGTNWQSVASTEENVTSTIISELAAGTYTVRVCAENSVGASDWSTATLVLAKPDAPDGLTFGEYDESTQSVSVSWIDNSSNEKNFRVEISSDGTNWQSVGTTEANVTSTIISELAAGTYTVRVCAENAFGASDWASAKLTVGKKSDGFSPSDLTLGAYDAATRSVAISWTDNSGFETGFRVEYSTDGGKTWKFSQAVAANITSRTAWGVASDSTYQFRVCAMRGCVKSDWAYSDELKTTLVFAAPGEMTLGAYDATTRSVTMSWQDNANAETGFRVEYSTDGGKTWNFSQILAANTTTRTAWGVNPNATYQFRVCALRGSEKSDWAYSDELKTTVVFAAPGDLTPGVYDATTRSVTLNWQDNSNAETGFRVEYSTDGGKTWKFSQAAVVNATSCTVWGVKPDATYQFRVCATRGAEKSDWTYSDELKTTAILTAPTDVTLGAYDAVTRNVTMNWKDNSNAETGFRVEYTTDGGKTWKFSQALAANATTRTAWGVKPDATYQFRVCATRGDERSDWAYSDELKTTAILTAPDDLTLYVYDATTRTVTTSWKDNSNAETGFRIEYSTDGGRTWKFSQTVPANVTTRTAWGVKPDATYLFRVCAIRGDEQSDWAYSDELKTTTPLAAPTDVSLGVYDETTRKVTMSWKDNSNVETGFRVEYTTDGGKTWKFSQTLAANVTTRTAWGVKPDATYQFRVCALRGDERSDWAYSKELKTTTPLAAPSELTPGVYDAATRKVTLSWKDNSRDETGFLAEYSTDGGETWKFSQELVANATSRTAWGVNADATYQFRVCALRGDERSDWAYSSPLDTSVSNASYDVPSAGAYALTLPIAVPLVEQAPVRVELIQDVFEDVSFVPFEDDSDFVSNLSDGVEEDNLFVDFFDDALPGVEF